LAALAAATFLGCAASRPLAPLAADQWAAEISVPGMWTKSEFAMPVGSVVPGVRYGVTADQELALRFHPLFLVKGIIGIELGGTWHMTPAWGWVPALHLSATLSSLTAPAHLDDGLSHGLRGAVAVDTIAHWEPWPWLWPYVVLQNALVLSNGRYVGSFLFGAQAQVGRSWAVSLETGLAGFNARDRDYSQPYLGLGGYGAIALSWSVTYRFAAPSPTTPEVPR